MTRAIADAAERYAAEGLAVFPLHHPVSGGCSCGTPDCDRVGKHPRTPNGFHAATNSVAQVREWWSRWPEANIGCVPGRSRHLVIDVDGPSGEATAQSLGLLSEPTLEVETGRVDGGRHRWYHHPGGTIGNTNRLGAGLDIRADDGYVILPPSVHASGRSYRWHGTLDEVIALPPHIAERFTQPSGATPGKPVAAIPLGPIPAGERNNTLTRYAGLLFAKGIAPAVVQALLVGLNETQCNPPLDASELAAIVTSIARAEANKPRRTGDRFLGVDVVPSETDGDVMEVLTEAEFCRITRGDELVAGVLPAGGEVVLTAPYSAGKTAFMLSLAAHVATGLDWYGRRVQQGPVLYLVAEGAPGAAGRWRRLRDDLGIVDAPVAFIRVPVTFMDPRTPVRILAGIRAKGLPERYAMLVADTGSRTGAGSEENSNDDAMIRLQTLSILARALGDPTRVLLHHPAKHGTDSRGASALEAAADTVIRLEKPRDSAIVTVSCDKQRDGERFAPFTFRLDGARVVEVEPPRDPNDWRLTTSRTLAPRERSALLVLDRAQHDPEYADGIPSTKWEAESKLSGGSWDEVRRRLNDLGFATVKTRVGRSVRYTITPEGMNALLPAA